MMAIETITQKQYNPLVQGNQVLYCQIGNVNACIPSPP